jgi:hypothetical protein
MQELMDRDQIQVLLSATARSQSAHPKTPDYVQEVMLSQTVTCPTGLTQAERNRYDQVLALMRGNARTNRHDADAAILFEAGKYCGYFLTEDKRIIRNRSKLQAIVGLCIVTLGEFLEIYDEVVEEERDREKLLATLG